MIHDGGFWDVPTFKELADSQNSEGVGLVTQLSFLFLDHSR